MVQRIRTVLIDDLTGVELDDEQAETIRFRWRNADYVIDLSRDHAAEFETTLRPYLDKARRLGAGVANRQLGSARRQKPSIDREQRNAIRAWGLSEGLPMSARGRIPESVVEAYQQAQTERRAG